MEGFPRNVEGFPRSVEEFPRSEEGFPLEVSTRPSDVSLGERSRRLLILGSTRDDGDGTTLPCVSIMVCPFKELSTSALSASPRRLTEGVLEVEGPTSADAGVASCLLVNTEPVFRRLRDDFCDGKIFAVGMKRLGIELQKEAPWECSHNSGAFAAQTVNWNFAIETRRDTWSNQATLQRQGFRMVTVGTKTKLENFSAAKDFFSQQPPNVSTLIHIL